MNEHCSHDRVRHGIGSAYYEIWCVSCKEIIGCSLSVAAAKKKVDSIALMLKIAKDDVVQSERFEAWQKAHPGVVPENAWI